MGVVRWGRAALDGSLLPKVRWGRASLDGTAPLFPKVRWGRAAIDGTAAVVITPLAEQTVEPESVVTLTSTVVSGGPVDSWTWRRISGSTITMSGTGGTRTFRAPSGMPPGGATVVIGVTATAGGVTSVERTVTITVLPQIRWSYTGSAWAGQRAAVAI